MTDLFDLTIRHGRLSNDRETWFADIGIVDGRIAAIGENLPAGQRDIDASGQWVLPGGIDSHCHIEQVSSMGMMTADDFHSGTVSAAFGGTTTIMPFAVQHRKQSIPAILADYSARAAAKAVIDYGFHLILAEPDEQALTHDLPKAIRDGITSLKVYMTYDRLKLDDAPAARRARDRRRPRRRAGDAARREPRHDPLDRAPPARARGHTAPKFHAVAHDPLVETEATNRAIVLSRLLDVPVLIVHVAGAETVEVIRSARAPGRAACTPRAARSTSS